MPGRACGWLRAGLRQGAGGRRHGGAVRPGNGRRGEFRGLCFRQAETGSSHEEGRSGKEEGYAVACGSGRRRRGVEGNARQDHQAHANAGSRCFLRRRSHKGLASSLVVVFDNCMKMRQLLSVRGLARSCIIGPTRILARSIGACDMCLNHERARMRSGPMRMSPAKVLVAGTRTCLFSPEAMQPRGDSRYGDVRSQAASRC